MLPSCDVLIAGAGPAGLSAAINAASEGLNVRLIDPGTIGGQARWSSAVENLAGFPRGITGSHYADRAYKQARKFGARLTIDRVETFCPLRDGTIAVQLHSARMIECRSLIVAVGLAAKPLTIPGHDHFGVFVGANPDDLPRYRHKSVAIIGGGNSAGQAAVAFASVGAIATLYVRRSLDQSMSRYLIDRLVAPVTVLEHTPVERIDPAPDGHLAIGDAIYSAIFSFVGAAPDHAFPLHHDPHGYIVADSYRTSLPRVYAIGDVRADSTKRIAAAIGEGSSVIARIHTEVLAHV